MTWSKSPAGSGGSGGGGATAVDVDGPGDSGQARLNELGYKQELKRDLSYVTPFFPLSFLSWFHRC
jgi:hypothetical protein